MSVGLNGMIQNPDSVIADTEHYTDMFWSIAVMVEGGFVPFDLLMYQGVDLSGLIEAMDGIASGHEGKPWSDKLTPWSDKLTPYDKICECMTVCYYRYLDAETMIAQLDFFLHWFKGYQLNQTINTIQTKLRKLQDLIEESHFQLHKLKLAARVCYP